VVYFEASTSYSNINYSDIDFLGWMPSEENVATLKGLASQSTIFLQPPKAEQIKILNFLFIQ